MNKEQQKKLITEIMNDDAKDGLYNQQTAVEWLVEQIFGEHTSVWDDVIKQAKQIEKEQITSAYRVGKAESDFPPEILTTGENYYNETYNK